MVSFGLFGDQGVFKSEATGAAQVVASRFGNGPIKVQYNSKKGGGATIEGLATSLQVASNGMDAENDVLFLILKLLSASLLYTALLIGHIMLQPKAKLILSRLDMTSVPKKTPVA